jgi:hypothetical protein
MKKAVIFGTIAASFTCESFSADTLLSMTQDDFKSRLDEYYSICSLPERFNE